MALTGLKINELDNASVVTNETVLPVVYINNGSASDTATKATLEQVKELVQEDNYTKTETDTLLNKKQDKLTAGDNITITEESDEVIIASTAQGGATYTAGTGIEISDSDEISVSSDVWTKDNLVGGANISIVKYVNPNIITDDTLGVWHLDNNANYISGVDKQTHSSTLDGSAYWDSTHKFGTGSCYSANVYVGGTWSISLNSTFTFDFWYLVNNINQSGVLAGFSGTGADSGAGVRITRSNKKHYLKLANSFDGTPVSSEIQIPSGSWKHIAVTYAPNSNENTGTAKVYIDGVYQTSCTIGKTSNAFTYLAISKATGFVDELRLQNGIVWDNDFTPPTEPYALPSSDTGDVYQINNTQDISTLATKTELSNGLATKQDTLVSGTNIKTVNNTSLLGNGNINIESASYTAGTGIEIDSDEISVSSDVWTKDNLVAGDNITITRQIDPNIADATKTLGLYHFDSNKNNSASNTLGLSYSEQNSYAIETSFYKFGPGCCHFYDAYGIKSDTEQTFTTAKSVDYWFKVSCHSISEEELFRFGSAIYLRAINTINQAGNDYNHDHFTLNGVSFNNDLMAQAFYDNQWHHLACTLSTTKFVLFIDGTKVIDQDRAGSFSTIYNYNRNWLYEAWMSSKYNSYIDEFRLTDDDLYSQLDSFTPPTTPYVLSTEPQDTYQINANINLGEDINAIESTSGTIALETNKVYKATLDGNTTFTLPATVDNTKFNQIYIQLDVIGDSDDSDEPIIDLGTTNYFGEEPVITSGLSWVNYEYNAIEQAWYVGKIGPNGSGGGGTGANTSLSNLTAAGKEVVANLSMPSTYKQELTVSVGLLYEAPADGYLIFGVTSSSNSTGDFFLKICPSNATDFSSDIYPVRQPVVPISGGSVGYFRGIYPIAKGMKFGFQQVNNANLDWVWFLRVKGSEPQQ